MAQDPQTAPRVARTVVVDLVVAVIIFLLGALVVYDSYRLGASWGVRRAAGGLFSFLHRADHLHFERGDVRAGARRGSRATSRSSLSASS